MQITDPKRVIYINPKIALEGLGIGQKTIPSKAHPIAANNC